MNDGALSFSPQFLSGPMHRAYTGGGALHPVHFTKTCPDGEGGTTVTQGSWNVSWLAIEKESDPSWVPKVSADGTTAADSADDGRFNYAWSFVSTPGP